MWPFDRKKTKQETADNEATAARTEEQQKARKQAMRRAVMKSMERRASDNAKKWAPPQLMPGVVPAGTTQPWPWIPSVARPTSFSTRQQVASMLPIFSRSPAIRIWRPWPLGLSIGLLSQLPRG